MKNQELTLQKIRKSFDFMDGGTIVDSYDSLWKDTNRSSFELYIHAPNRQIDPNQVKEFNLFMTNRNSLMTQIDIKMRELLHKNGTSQNLIDQPLQISILSVMYQEKDFESNPCDYTIEIICAKSYKTFFISRGVEIVAQVKNLR